VSSVLFITAWLKSPQLTSPAARKDAEGCGGSAQCDCVVRPYRNHRQLDQIGGYGLLYADFVVVYMYVHQTSANISLAIRFHGGYRTAVSARCWSTCCWWCQILQLGSTAVADADCWHKTSKCQVWSESYSNITWCDHLIDGSTRHNRNDIIESMAINYKLYTNLGCVCWTRAYVFQVLRFGVYMLANIQVHDRFMYNNIQRRSTKQGDAHKPYTMQRLRNRFRSITGIQVKILSKGRCSF